MEGVKKVRWPFLWDLVQKEYFLFLDYFFAETIHPEGSENEAALLLLLMAFSREGHICIQLQALKSDFFIKDSLCSFRLEMMAKEGAKTVQLKEICKEGDRIYLQRNWLYEKCVEKNLERLLSQNLTEAQDLEFSASLTKEQQSAFENSIRYPLSIITGGPGTGKTFTAKEIVAHFLKRGARQIILCAPTGKAVRTLASKCPVERVVANTLHTILKVGKELEMVNADLIIVDECSMVDAALFARLLSSIKEGVHLVLMGDADQLPAVEGGSFFADLIRASGQGAPLPCTHLTRCLRSEELQVLSLSAAIKKGEWTALEKKCEEEEIWEEVKNFFPFPSPSIPQGEELFKKMGQFRILSTLRKGRFGVDTLNEKIAEMIVHKKRADEYCAIPIMICRNDERTGLYNGEMGILVKSPNSEEDYALFEGSRKFSALLLPSYEYAYCLSVHKSQGSEYEKVLLLLPEGSDCFGRELLYTAVTRAKKSIEVRGSLKLIHAMLSRSCQKNSGLCLLETIPII